MVFKYPISWWSRDEGVKPLVMICSFKHPSKQKLHGNLPTIFKPSKLDEQDVLDTAGEVRMNS